MNLFVLLHNPKLTPNSLQTNLVNSISYEQAIHGGHSSPTFLASNKQLSVAQVLYNCLRKQSEFFEQWDQWNSSFYQKGNKIIVTTIWFVYAHLCVHFVYVWGHAGYELRFKAKGVRVGLEDRRSGSEVESGEIEFLSVSGCGERDSAVLAKLGARWFNSWGAGIQIGQRDDQTVVVKGGTVRR